MSDKEKQRETPIQTAREIVNRWSASAMSLIELEETIALALRTARNDGAVAAFDEVLGPQYLLELHRIAHNDALEKAEEVDPLAVRCPLCRQPPASQCTAAIPGTEHMEAYHDDRWHAAIRALKREA